MVTEIVPLQISESSLRDAVIKYMEFLDRKTTHIHLRIGADGVAYADEDTSHSISEDEFNRVPGHTRTVKHQSGHGTHELPVEWMYDDCGIDAIAELTGAILKDLRRAGVVFELV